MGFRYAQCSLHLGLFCDGQLFIDDVGFLFVMSPHSNDLNGPYFFQDLIDEAVLDWILMRRK